MATSVPETEPDPGHYGDTPAIAEPKEKKIRDDGKWELEETDAWEVLGYSFPTW